MTEASADHNQTLRVLLVDDDDDQGVLIRELLRDAYGPRFDLACAAGYDGALAELAATDYDVCLIDHHLGARTGLELIHAIRAQASAVPCIMLTGSLDPQVEAAAADAGAADYLEKDGLTSRSLQRSIRYSLERRRAADALRASEQRFRTLIENATEGVVVMNPQGKPVYASGPVARILGYTPEELLSMEAPALLHPDDRGACLAALDRCVRNIGATETLEARHRHRDGSWRWMQCVLVNRVDERAVNGLVANVRDVTESVLMVQALRLQAEVGRILADASSADQIRPALLRTVGDVLQARYALKWRLDEPTGDLRAVDSWTKPGDERAAAYAEASRRMRLAPGESAISRAVTSGQPTWFTDVSMEPGYVRKGAAADAGVRAVLIVPIQGRPHKSRGVLEVGWGHAYECNPRLLEMVAAIGRQLGQSLDRLETQSALLERDNQLRALFDRGSDAILILDDDGVYLDANPAAEELFGVPRERLVGSPPGEFVAPESRAAAQEAWSTLQRGAEATGEIVLMRSTGERRFVDYRATPGFMPHRHLSVMRDVTEQRKLEQQLLHSQKMETIGRLAGGIAHDFNNLLTAICGNAELARGDLADGQPCATNIDEVLKAARSAAALTGQLLAFSRKQLMQSVAFDLNEAVAGMERMLRRLIGEDIELSTVLAPDLVPVRSDPAQIEQVLVNLAVNARDAMPSGGKLTIQTSFVEVDGTYAAQHPGVPSRQFVVLTVTDTGVGMDADTLSRIFEPFFTTKGPGRGTGLGLATVYGIVRQSGGHIRVYSEPGLGTTFTVYLPPATGESVVRPAPEPESPERGSGTILVVEDAEPVRRLTVEILRGAGYSVIEAANGDEACALLKPQGLAIDLLFTDVVMPGMSGRELFERLSPRCPSMRVVYCSGYTEEAVVQHGVANRGRAFLQKPYTRAGLLRTVRLVLCAPE